MPILTTGSMCPTTSSCINKRTGATVYDGDGWCLPLFPVLPTCKAKGKGREYINAPVAFDTETTSFYEDGSKRAVMYAWMVAIKDRVFMGRTWAGLLSFFDQLVTFYQLGDNLLLPIYVHNLAFEFQFLAHRLEWKKVFSVEERKPLYAQTVDGLEFRCSYLLTGYSLAKLGEQLHEHKVAKLVGDLDYNKPRHEKTPLTDDEVGYCINDVLVLTAYIAEQIKTEGDVSKIPMTKTGYVRRYCYKKTMNDKDKKARRWYHEMIKNLTLTRREYELLKLGYAGGYVHASAYHSRQTLEHVGSFDFTSDYPARAVECKYPMGKGHEIQITEEEIPQRIKTHCLLMVIGIKGLLSRDCIDHPLSASKCSDLRGATEDNGRLVSADVLVTVATEQDYLTYKDFYTWSELKIFECWAYRKDYLPTSFVNALLDLYAKKTELKGVKGSEKEYQVSKENLNSCYGMMVTDPCRETVNFEDGEWSSTEPDTDEALEKYNKSKNRFLFYPWGVWITAYARRALFVGMLAFKDDYAYSDTDSIKSLHPEAHMDFIRRYNAEVTARMDRACRHHGIDPERTRPRTINGVQKQLGVWDYEGVYTRFRTIGAKRYITEEDGKILITVSGVNKYTAAPYLLDKYGPDGAFEHFDDGLYIPPEYSGKLTHTYIDSPREGWLRDYLGNECYYYEESSVHLEQAEYKMSLSSAYIDYLLDVVEVER